MASEASSLKKIAVLTGLTMVMGGAEVSGATAATTTPQIDAFTVTVFTFNSGSQNLSFQKFDSSLGNLTSVDFSLDSTLLGFGTATISVDGVQLSSNPFDNTSTAGPYDASFTGLVGAANTTFYTGSGTFNALLSLTNNSEFDPDVWNGQTSGETGLTLTYDYTPTTTPLPGSLPLLATGLGGLGLAAWRRRRQKPAV